MFICIDVYYSYGTCRLPYILLPYILSLLLMYCFYVCRFGRKKTLMASLIMQLTLGILVAICPWFEFYMVLRFILGFVCVSIVFSGFVLCKYYEYITGYIHTN